MRILVAAFCSKTKTRTATNNPNTGIIIKISISIPFIPKEQTQTNTAKMTVEQLIKEAKPTYTPCSSGSSSDTSSDTSSESSLLDENSSIMSILPVRGGAVSTEVLRTAMHEKTQLARFPRIHLAHLPTPLEYCPRLSAALGGVDIYVKRDDCTGLGTGGNKARKLGEHSYSYHLDTICLLDTFD
jgi:hypothetical protein